MFIRARRDAIDYDSLIAKHPFLDSNAVARFVIVLAAWSAPVSFAEIKEDARFGYSINTVKPHSTALQTAGIMTKDDAHKFLITDYGKVVAAVLDPRQGALSAGTTTAA